MWWSVSKKKRDFFYPEFDRQLAVIVVVAAVEVLAVKNLAAVCRGLEQTSFTSLWVVCVKTYQFAYIKWFQ